MRKEKRGRSRGRLREPTLAPPLPSPPPRPPSPRRRRWRRQPKAARHRRRRGVFFPRAGCGLRAAVVGSSTGSAPSPRRAGVPAVLPPPPFPSMRRLLGLRGRGPCPDPGGGGGGRAGGSGDLAKVVAGRPAVRLLLSGWRGDGRPWPGGGLRLRRRVAAAAKWLGAAPRGLGVDMGCHGVVVAHGGGLDRFMAAAGLLWRRPSVSGVFRPSITPLVVRALPSS